MEREEVIELKPTEQEQARAKELVQKNHKKGLDIEKAQELGLFSRISFLTCAVTTLYTTAAKITGEIDNLFQIAGSDRHEIKMELEAVHKAYERFARFFRNYQTMDGVNEMNEETEQFYHQYMRWCNLPENWSLGKKQLTDPETDPLILIEKPDKDLRFYRSILESEDLTEEEVEYCVTKYDPKVSKQETVEDGGLDKSSAQMVAKRNSANDPTCIYTASKLITKEQKITEILPLKAYENGKLVGSYRKVFKSQNRNL